MISKKCSYCSKIIEGYTEKQVNYLMQQHILSKHKDKVKFIKSDIKLSKKQKAK